MSSTWSQLEQLLTCAICLDRYRNPKLLPCHHTYCQEPCLEGLVDYARRQIKCPECRAEHRIPYQGVQTFQTNVTLVRFLELHRGITGEEPEPIPSMMERCGVCSEKSSVERCAHCDKKICPECKEAHLDILKREIVRINSQVRRALTRLTESIGSTEKNCEKLMQNQSNNRDEIEEIVRRFIKDLKNREAKLLADLDEYANRECKNLQKLKEDLEIEATNIGSNCDLVEKHVLMTESGSGVTKDTTEGSSSSVNLWTDSELQEYKDIFVKSLEFLRNFDPDTSEYTRGIKFLANHDLDILRKNIVNFGELKLPLPESETSSSGNGPLGNQLSPIPSNFNSLSVPSSVGNALMRSQSDHRLAAQFARNERASATSSSSRYLDVSGSQSKLSSGYSDSTSCSDNRGERGSSPLSSRRVSRDEKYSSTNSGSGTSGSRYGSDRTSSRRESEVDSYTRKVNDYTRDWPRPDDPDPSCTDGTQRQFKSRFMRDRRGGGGGGGSEKDRDDDDTFTVGHYTSSSSSRVRFEEPAAPPKEIPKVFDTLDAPRGPLSGIIKLQDTSHLMTRLHENQMKLIKLEAERKEAEIIMTTQNITGVQPTPPVRRAPSRQLSEDEIDKQKKANKAAEAAASAVAAASLAATTEIVTPSVTNTPTPTAPQTTRHASPVTQTSTNTTDSPTSRYVPRWVSTLKEEEESRSPTPSRKTPEAPPTSRRPIPNSNVDLDDDEEESAVTRLMRRRKSSMATEIESQTPTQRAEPLSAYARRAEAAAVMTTSASVSGSPSSPSSIDSRQVTSNSSSFPTSSGADRDAASATTMTSIPASSTTPSSMRSAYLRDLKEEIKELQTSTDALLENSLPNISSSSHMTSSSSYPTSRTTPSFTSPRDHQYTTHESSSSSTPVSSSSYSNVSSSNPSSIAPPVVASSSSSSSSSTSSPYSSQRRSSSTTAPNSSYTRPPFSSRTSSNEREHENQSSVSRRESLNNNSNNSHNTSSTSSYTPSLIHQTSVDEDRTSLARTRHTPYVSRSSTVAVTPAEHKPYSLRDYSSSHLRSRSPSTEREIVTKSTTDTSSSYTRPTLSRENSRSTSSPPPSTRRSYTSTSTTGIDRPDFTRYRSTRDYSSRNNNDSSISGTRGLSRSNTVGDILSRSSSFLYSDDGLGISSSRDRINNHSSSYTTHTPSASSATRSSLSGSNDHRSHRDISSTSSSRDTGSTYTSSRRPLTSSLTLSDATSNNSK